MIVSAEIVRETISVKNLQKPVDESRSICHNISDNV